MISGTLFYLFFSPFFSCVLSTPHNRALVASYIYIRFSRGVIQCPIFPATSPWHARDLRIWQSRRASRDRCSISSSDWDAGSEYCGMPRAMRIHLTPAIRTGFVFCFVNCGLLLVTGLAINKGMIPSGYGYSAIVSLHCLHWHFSAAAIFVMKCEIQQLNFICCSWQ